jgi:hypothetical protein
MAHPRLKTKRMRRILKNLGKIYISPLKKDLTPSCSRNDLTITVTVNLLVFIFLISNYSTFHRSSFSGEIHYS